MAEIQDDPNLEDPKLEDPNDPPADPVDPPVDPEPPKKDRYKEDLLKQKEENRILVAKLEAEQKKSEEIRISKMKEKEQYKELYEEEQRKREEAEAKSGQLSQAIVEDKKHTAVKTLALQMGLRKEALNDLDLISLEDLEIETTSTGRVIVNGTKEFVEDLKIRRPHWFGKRSTNLNPGSPEVIPSDGTVTLDMIKKAEQASKKSGDLSNYQALVMKYKKQQISR